MKITQLVAIVALLTFASAQAAPPDAPSVRIAKYKGDRAAALSYTFDDGRRDHYTLVYPMLEEFAFKGTFFVVGSTVQETDELAAAAPVGSMSGLSWGQVKELAAHGHEIGNHSWRHKNMKLLDDTELHAEIDMCDAAIRDKVGVVPVSFCYPGNSRDDRVRAVVLQTYVAARDFQTEIGTETYTTDTANAWADKNVATGGWGVAMIHGISTGYHPLSSPDVLRNHLAYVKAHDSSIWVDTFGHVACYNAERDSATIQNVTTLLHGVRFVVDGTRNAVPYTVPLTIVVGAAGTKGVKATRAGVALPVVIRGTDILIDAAPSAEPITLEWK
ncbi:MAG TPA: polysaccharide deacetylase family protein [Capsulimonadaceae bacterium]|jgi:peptidoglycan/xylan/chitin deacetylase (PgdA/CDA1 family)